MASISIIIRRCTVIGEAMFFSIIVPVYKVQDYIEECINSILSQSYDDYELILVDDGSPDKCPQICDNYSLRDKRVRVIHKENGGLSSARNAGLDVAEGKYIVFVDSDDIVYPNSLKELQNMLFESPDVLITEYYSSPKCSLENTPDILFTSPSSCKKTDVIPFVFYEKKNTWASVQYIIKKDLIERYQLRFEIGYFHEDISWTGQLFLYSQTYAYYNKVWYVRRPDREESITNTIKPKRTLDTIELVSRQIYSADYDNLSDAERRIMFNQYIRAVFSSLIHYSKYERIDQLKIAKEITKNIEIFDYALARRHSLFVSLMKTIGVDCSLKLYCALFVKPKAGK